MLQGGKSNFSPTRAKELSDDEIEPNEPLGEGYVQVLEEKVRSMEKELMVLAD